MVPAPSQGAIAVVCRADDERVLSACKSLDHADTRRCTASERSFLRDLMGGCSMPIAALMTINQDGISFTGCVHALDGTQEARVDLKLPLDETNVGLKAAEAIRQRGADQILAQIRSHES